MRLEAPAGKEDASHQPSGLSPKTMWEAEAHPKQGLCPSQQLTYSSWVETPCPLVFHLENSPEMIQPPCQTEEAALGGEQLLLFALHGNLFFFSQNSSLPWVDEDTVAIYSEIMSVMHYQRSCGLFCTWDFHVSQNRKRFNFFPHHKNYHLFTESALCYKVWTKHFIFLSVLVVKTTVSKACYLTSKSGATSQKE